MATYQINPTAILIVEWDADDCFLTCGADSLRIPRALAPQVAAELWPAGPTALREIVALGPPGAAAVTARDMAASGVDLEDALVHALGVVALMAQVAQAALAQLNAAEGGG